MGNAPVILMMTPLRGWHMFSMLALEHNGKLCRVVSDDGCSRENCKYTANLPPTSQAAGKNRLRPSN